MKSRGIYILANDVVYDKLIALLNSIEANVSTNLPVCIIPYDDRLEKVKRLLDTQLNATLFDNWESIQRWEDFADAVWSGHSRANQSPIFRPSWYKGGASHFCNEYKYLDKKSAIKGRIEKK